MCGRDIANQVRSVLENSPEAFQSAMDRVVLAVASAYHACFDDDMEFCNAEEL